MPTRHCYNRHILAVTLHGGPFIGPRSRTSVAASTRKICICAYPDAGGDAMRCGSLTRYVGYRVCSLNGLLFRHVCTNLSRRHRGCSVGGAGRTEYSHHQAA